VTSFLAGSLAKQIARGFKGKLLVGTIRRAGPYTLDDFGDSVSSGNTTYAFTGMRESFDARYRAQALIPETDVKILVLLASVIPPITPVQSDQILINGEWHQVRRVLDVDPASATMSLQAFVIPTPDDLASDVVGTVLTDDSGVVLIAG
jgi:hypothetical protein